MTREYPRREVFQAVRVEQPDPSLTAWIDHQRQLGGAPAMRARMLWRPPAEPSAMVRKMVAPGSGASSSRAAPPCGARVDGDLEHAAGADGAVTEAGTCRDLREARRRTRRSARRR
jgi:hypothetical protein